MMDSLRELYQDVILDHHRKPRNRREMPEASAKASGYNPLCGDRVSVFVKIEDDVLEDVSFVGSGCAISQASASMMTDCMKGRTRADVARVAEAFQRLVTDEGAAMPEGDELVEKLEAFAGVREFPSRVKCASLAWHALRVALERPGETVSTE
jgi:nitrogen fixation protein NifU and related proteins